MQIYKKENCIRRKALFNDETVGYPAGTTLFSLPAADLPGICNMPPYTLKNRQP